MAEGILNDIIEKNNTKHLFEIDSSGTGNYHIGETPDPRTIKNASANGILLTHKCRQFNLQDFYDFDYIIPMDDSNLKNILLQKPKDKLSTKVIKMRFFDPLNKNSDVPDPWFGGEQGFEKVYQILKLSCQNFYDSLIG